MWEEKKRRYEIYLVLDQGGEREDEEEKEEEDNSEEVSIPTIYSQQGIQGYEQSKG